VATDDSVAVLTALDCWGVSQRAVGVPEWGVSTENIPDGLLVTLEGFGYTVAGGM
jgi:hypothetical protein